jgi:hypothetical protein
MPQRGSPYLNQAREVFLRLKSATHPDITMERVVKYHLKRERLLAMIAKIAARQYGDGWADVLKEKYDFVCDQQQQRECQGGGNSGDVQQIPGTQDTFQDFSGKLTSYPELVCVGPVDPAIVGSECFVGGLRISTINSEQSRSNPLGHSILRLPSTPGDVLGHDVATRWVSGFAAGSSFLPSESILAGGWRKAPHGVLLPCGHCITSQELVLRAICSAGSLETSRAVSMCVEAFPGVFRTNSIYRAIGVCLVRNRRAKALRYVSRLPSKRLYSCVPMNLEDHVHDRWYEHMCNLVLNMPFNHSGKGWAKPEEMHRISISQGVNLPVTACHSWSATLGVLTNMNGVYSANFPRIFSIHKGSCRGMEEYGLFSLMDIKPGMPIGVLYGKPAFTLEFEAKAKRLGHPSVMENCPRINRFMVIDSTGEDGAPLRGFRNPCAYINMSTKERRKRANVTVCHVHPGLAVYYAGARGIKKNTELLVKA